jgi:general secretion pathway protein N
MVKRTQINGMVLLLGGLLMGGAAPQLRAATSATMDILSSDRGGDTADTVDIGGLKPIARPVRDAGKPLPGGNPLWSIPLSVLTATQERPIFSASRRPPQPAVIAPPVDQVQARASPPKPAEPEHPTLTLIGAVVGDGDAVAVFLDRSNQKSVRLRLGESHAGWVLSSVQRREATLKKADLTEAMALQRSDGSAGIPGASGSAAPATAGVDVSYAPLNPR